MRRQTRHSAVEDTGLSGGLPASSNNTNLILSEEAHSAEITVRSTMGYHTDYDYAPHPRHAPTFFVQ
jgi:hypothetical protein